MIDENTVNDKGLVMADRRRFNNQLYAEIERPPRLRACVKNQCDACLRPVCVFVAVET